MTEFPVIYLYYSDFRDVGYNPAALSDKDMVHAASLVKKYLLDELTYWNAVRAVATDLNLPLFTECL